MLLSVLLPCLLAHRESIGKAVFFLILACVLMPLSIKSPYREAGSYLVLCGSFLGFSLPSLCWCSPHPHSQVCGRQACCLDNSEPHRQARLMTYVCSIFIQ